jgi:hypothetical protein
MPVGDLSSGYVDLPEAPHRSQPLGHGSGLDQHVPGGVGLAPVVLGLFEAPVGQKEFDLRQGNFK